MKKKKNTFPSNYAWISRTQANLKPPVLKWALCVCVCVTALWYSCFYLIVIHRMFTWKVTPQKSLFLRALAHVCQLLLLWNVTAWRTAVSGSCYEFYLLAGISSSFFFFFSQWKPALSAWTPKTGSLLSAQLLIIVNSHGQKQTKFKAFVRNNN